MKAEFFVLDTPVRPVGDTGLTAQTGLTGPERNIRRLAFKYVLIDDELYRRTAEDLLLKCLDSDQAKLLWVRFMRAFVVLINRLPR